MLKKKQLEVKGSSFGYIFDLNPDLEYLPFVEFSERGNFELQVTDPHNKYEKK